MALTLSGTNGVVGAGFTVDASGVSVTAGVGTFSSIGAGASVPAAGLTGSLPTISAANCTNIPAANITGTLPAISGANLTGITAGITMVDTWDLSGVISMGNDTETTITTQWSRANDFNGVIGSAMTVDSNGIFTFPSTGIYRITYHLSMYSNSNTQARYATARIKATTNNSDYVTRSQAIGNGIQNSGYVYIVIRADYIMDVTDTSTHKVYFTALHDQPATVNGDASADSNLHTYAMFMRLGDT